MPDDGHARFSATERATAIASITARTPSCAVVPTCSGLPGRCGHDRGLRTLLGKHDFTSFCRTGSDAKTMDCDLREARWEALTTAAPSW